MRRSHSRMFAEELGMKQGDWTWRNRRRGEDLQLAYLLPWSQWLAGSYRVPADVGVAMKQLVEEGILE